MVFSFTKSHGGLLLALALAFPGVSVAQSGAPSAQALAYFTAQGERQGLHGGDATNPTVTSSYFDQSSGLTHTYLRQRVNGVDIYGAVGDVHTDRSGKPVLMHQGFVVDAARLAPSAVPTLTPEQAVSAAAKALQLPKPVGLTLVRDARAADGVLFNNGGISEYDIPVRLLYFPINGQLKLVWDVNIAQLDQQHHWTARVDAHTGQLLDKTDFVVSEEVTFQQITARALHSRPAAVTAASANRGGLGAANSMTVLPVPVEAPSFGVRASVPFPSATSANAAYSPYGWHVADPRATVAGTSIFPGSYSRLAAGVYLTRGNNVAAYDDSQNTTSGSGNILSNTNSPDGGATLDFDFPFNPATSPKLSSPAIITNLFYWNNMLHDVMASKGFDEASGNFQYKNAGTQGLGGDYVRAESQDGSGRNNANFSTPADGQPGRMQMYLWDNALRPTFTITAPAALAGSINYGTADFGRSIATLPAGICGTIVAVNDGVSGNSGLHGCATPYLNTRDVSGKIALIMRGGCAQLTGGVRTPSSFAGKVRRAQQNGAIMAIIIDSVATNTVLSNMTGTDTVGIRIPSIFLSGADGARILASLRAGTPVTGCATASPDYDGSLDNGIVSHEFGHGISNRLTGGPSNSNCVTQQYLPNGSSTAATTQCMGEGWSDFFALWMTTRVGDVGRTPRGTGTYVVGEAPTGAGIRYKTYTDDMAVNNYTYGVVGTGNYNETHALGEVWATVLWDLNWQFIYRNGFNPDFLAQTGGNNQFLKLVLQGCKLQVCNPGFLDGRDAILRADSLLNNHANSALIWTVFARRGMGKSAQQGPRVAVNGYPNGLPGLTGIVAAFDMPTGVRPVTLLNPAATPLGTQSASAINGSLVSAYPNPAQNVLTVQAQLASKSEVQVSLINLVGQAVISTTTNVTDVQRGLELNTSTLAAGLYVVRITTSEGIFTTKVQVKH
ncbi:M36 family metallopeptidase [Hymenobacter armeniacus]|uniref:M36 family metallopeptidase n=1 Tax=Hymenobacter armeniacus TaxID=2771358 RepID=A0ABR8K261_9BACT|nr:M36 family metallopeptidase [Hymenobacter armeniacus]MBD2724629.1 M36 family metallopeptidase [Hymenobacter armeniacus]